MYLVQCRAQPHKHVSGMMLKNQQYTIVAFVPLYAPFKEWKLADETAQMRGVRKDSQEFAIATCVVAAHAICNCCKHVCADGTMACTCREIHGHPGTSTSTLWIKQRTYLKMTEGTEEMERGTCWHSVFLCVCVCETHTHTHTKRLATK